MAKKPKRRPAAQKTADARLLAKLDEKRVLANNLRAVRVVEQLSRKLKREIQKADDGLRGLSAWLSAREWEREATDERTDKPQPEPANT